MSRTPVTLTEALRPARPRFWRFFWPTFGTGILVGIVSLVLSTILGGVFGSDSDAAPVGANLLAAVVRAPFIYLATGVVLGGVGWAEAISRSTRLARARFRLAVMAAIFDVVAQYLLVFAASAVIWPAGPWSLSTISWKGSIRPTCPASCW